MLISRAANISLHHNLFTSNAQRNPQFHDVELFDFRHNVVRQRYVYGLRVRGHSSGNIVGNVFARSANREKNPAWRWSPPRRNAMRLRPNCSSPAIWAPTDLTQMHRAALSSPSDS